MIRRFIMLCLLLVLPFQLSWAVAGTYCEHEHGQAAQHFGHHDHEHHDGSNESAPGGVDRDCGYHHQATPQWLPSVSQAPALFDIEQHLFSQAFPMPTEFLLERPERPKWLSLA